jgi:hypothetical protein
LCDVDFLSIVDFGSAYVADTYVSIAKAFPFYLRIAAVNGEQEPTLVDYFNITWYPTIIMYNADGTRKASGTTYKILP